MPLKCYISAKQCQYYSVCVYVQCRYNPVCVCVRTVPPQCHRTMSEVPRKKVCRGLPPSPPPSLSGVGTQGRMAVGQHSTQWIPSFMAVFVYFCFYSFIYLYLLLFVAILYIFLSIFMFIYVYFCLYIKQCMQD